MTKISTGVDVERKGRLLDVDCKPTKFSYVLSFCLYSPLLSVPFG